MACAERKSLWAYAAGEVEAEARERLEQHLAGCELCRQELEAVRATREVLDLAAPVVPEVDWREADEKVRSAAERRFLKLERGPWNWSLAFALGAGAVAVVVAMLAVGRQRAPAVDLTGLPDLDALAAAPLPSSVEAADGALASLDREERLLKQGDALMQGTALRTTVAGRAIFKLPEGSRVRVAPATDLVVERAARDEVGLLLNKGRVAVKATKAARKDFVVRAGGATVRVVGTAFSVGRTDEAVDVAVTEGRVLVDLPDREPKIMQAGERWVFDLVRSELRPAPITQADRSEMGELGVEVALAEAKKPRPPRPAVVAALPPPSPSPSPPAAEPERIPITAPVNPEAARDLPAGRPVVAVPSPLPAAEKPAAPGLESIPAERLQFLHAAEYALEKGNCETWLQTLTSYLEDHEVELQGGREPARIYKARCLKSLKRSVEADREYRKYLEEFPTGRYAAEARAAVAH